ncbi:MAG: hypothetical protein JWQ01_2782 [Massilia sp.]|nr:hypothetical protein [Massilia sp.]
MKWKMNAQNCYRYGVETLFALVAAIVVVSVAWQYWHEAHASCSRLNAIN